MARTIRTGGRDRARGSFGQWTTADRTDTVHSHAGWDAAGLAVVDAGGAGLRGITQDMPGADPAPAHRTTRRTPRTTSRRGGRR